MPAIEAAALPPGQRPGQRLVLANSLQWLAPEIDSSLQRARALIDQQQDAEAAELDAAPVLVELRMVLGALRMAGCHGGALLAEELCQTVEAAASGRLASPGAALAAVSGATLQLSDYLDALRHAAPDRAAVLQPAISELRLAAERVAATEAELFTQQMLLIDCELPRPPETERSASAGVVAGKLLPAFQSLLLQWLKGVDVPGTLAKLRKIGDHIGDHVTRRDTLLLWRAFAAAMDSLIAVPTADATELKRWAGRLTREIKQLAEQGEEPISAQGRETAWRLLAHAAPVSTAGTRWAALRQQLPLDATLPLEPALSAARRQLRGPNTRLLEKVADEVRADLALVKDGLDLALRSGGLSAEGQQGLADKLGRIANTLLLLSLPQLEQVLRSQSGALATLGSAEAGDQGRWMGIATALLRVEHSLETALYKPLRQVRSEEPAGELIETVPHAQDLRESVAALLREMLVDLAKLKARLDAYLKGGELRDAKEPLQLIGEVASGLVILDRLPAAGLARELSDWLTAAGPEQLRDDPALAVQFAESIAALELYLEALRDALPQPERMLETLSVALACLAPPAAAELAFPIDTGVPDKLDLEVLSLADDGLTLTSPAPDVATLATGDAGNADDSEAFAPIFGRPVETAPAPPAEAIAAGESAEPMPAPESERVGIVEPEAPEAAAPPAAAGDDDPEIRAIFIEEAQEVLDTLKRLLPLFRRDSSAPETLGDIRRAFHTLKGSGRMVGATRIGEFGWAVEHLLNRCIEGSLPVNRAVVGVVDEAVLQLPALLQQFSEHEPGAIDDGAHALVARAHFLASGRAPEMVENEVLEVFRTDAIDRLGDIERWLAEGEVSYIDSDTIRALHTLKGSAAVVNAEPLSQLAGAFEAVMKRFVAADLAVSPEVRAVLAEALPVLREWTDKAGQTAAPVNAAEWLARVEALKAFLPPAGETKSYSQREAVVNLAFDRLQVVEQRLMAWMAAPAEVAMGGEMADAAEALTIVAEPCLPLARGASALTERLRAPDLRSSQPDTAFFQALANTLEHFYQFLDAYREGGVRDSGRELAELIRRLPARSQMPAGTTDEAPALQAVLEDDPRAAPEIALEQPQDVPAAGLTLTADEGELQLEPLELVPIPHAVPVPPEELDPELAGVFADEARDLLDTLKTQVPAWQPALAPPPTILRALHTLTGSARMAGYNALGDIAHGFERRFQNVEPGATATTVLRAELLATLPVFEQAIDAFSVMLLPPAAETAAEPPAPPALAESVTPPVADEPQAQPAGLPDISAVEEATATSLLDGDDDDGEADAVIDMARLRATGDLQKIAEVTHSIPNLEAIPPATLTPVLQPMPSLMDSLARYEAGTGPAVVPMTAIEAVDPTTEIDPELAGIFMAEAGETLEKMGAALADWRRNAGDLAAIGELQRALHTLKGGARMTGFMAMGEVAHDMESRLSELLMRGVAPDATDHAALRADLETLERMHDAISRGRYADTVRAATPDHQLLALDESEEADATRIPIRRAPAPEIGEGWEANLFWRPAEDESNAARRELARVPVESLDAMLNEAGEISIYRSRLEQQNALLVAQLAEMRQTVSRLREQLRLMDAETDAQIAARGLDAQAVATETDRYGHDFDPLEMDRYSRMQELSRALAEAVGDLSSLHQTMDQGVNDAQALLLQQGRINNAVQQGLMGTLMVPFSRQVARLQRVVRQTAQELGKEADVRFEGVESELDRNVLERMTAPLEHLLRNAVVHGLEMPDARAAAGKPTGGTVTVSLKREGTQLLMEIVDDGRGLDFAAIRTKAIEKGLLPIGAELSDEEIARFIFEAGFSTAETLTQNAGRGVGMDVVSSEVKQLGGSLELRSEPGRGARFSIRLPLSLALSQALMVKIGEETYALPLVAIEGIGRVPRTDALTAVGGGEATLSYAGNDYRVRPLAEFIDLPHALPEDSRTVPAVLVRMGEGIAGAERRVALLVDQLLGNREVVSKAVGPQLSSISGVSGATILPSGEVVLVLDPAALVIDRARRRLIAEAAASRSASERQATPAGRLVMVVDDSVTMRRVAERLLLRNGYRVITAKDGLDAIAMLQNESPAAILLDIEMPRADGFEVAGFIRNNERIANTPIIMITSRSGEKHRARAASLGVNRYLIKPYQEEQLLHELRSLLQMREAERA